MIALQNWCATAAEAMRLHSASISPAWTSDYLRHDRITSGHALAWLQQGWTDDGQPEARFADFETTLVREWLRLCREETRHEPSKKEPI
jgi:hypothetical protein